MTKTYILRAETFNSPPGHRFHLYPAMIVSEACLGPGFVSSQKIGVDVGRICYPTKRRLAKPPYNRHLPLNIEKIPGFHKECLRKSAKNSEAGSPIRRPV